MMDITFESTKYLDPKTDVRASSVGVGDCDETDVSGVQKNKTCTKNVASVGEGKTNLIYVRVPMLLMIIQNYQK